MFEFVDELPGGLYAERPRTPNRELRTQAKLLFDFAAALRERPMTWAVWPRPLTRSSAAATVHTPARQLLYCSEARSRIPVRCP